MLDKLPTEIIEQILGHLLTASSVVNIALTNRRLHTIASANNYAIFKSLVQKGFPSITTPPLWRDVACALTSRSRAWERRAFVARECSRPDDAPYIGHTAYQSFGYIPLIDSYEQCLGSTLRDRKQVLAFGAGGRLQLRTVEKGHVEWKTYREENDDFAFNEIMHVQLLRPHQNTNVHGESVILIRENGSLERVESGTGKDNIEMTTRYLTMNGHFDCMDISASSDPLMAVCNTQTLQLFPVNTSKRTARPALVLPFSHYTSARHRKRSIKFLDDHIVATGIQSVEGREVSPVMIYDISSNGITTSSYQPLQTMTFAHAIKGRHCANVLTNLDSTASLAGRPGQVFLSGWSDGISRLHDRRTPLAFVAQYVDFVDDGQILSLATVGHERFFAASHQNACLKCFDMRMPGARAYSYLEAQPQPQQGQHRTKTRETASSVNRREINIFLALAAKRDPSSAHPRGRAGWRGLSRYRGSIYSLSTPSPYSTTLFAGIENRVIEIDFVNTDDVLRRRQGVCDPAAGLPTLTAKPEADNVLSLSCYERPRDSHIITDPVLLRKQMDWSQVVDGGDSSRDERPEKGWDSRWQLAQSRRDGVANRSWRSDNTAEAAPASTSASTSTSTSTRPTS